MNYITHQTNTFAMMDQIKNFKSHHISLYLTLFRMWNANRFNNPISISRQETMALARIGSPNTYIRALKDLHKHGFIRYDPSYDKTKGSLIILYRFDTISCTPSGSKMSPSINNQTTPSIEEEKNTSSELKTNAKSENKKLNHMKQAIPHPCHIKIYFMEKGLSIYGPHFRLYDEDMDIIKKLFVYFIRDDDQAKLQGMDIRKGILQIGPVGCGKTALMRLIPTILPAQLRFQVKACRDISFEFQKSGYDIIQTYSRKSFKVTSGSSTPVTICLDDLGAETNIKHYGSECNVMAEIIQSRYDLFITDRLLTHATTNLNALDIEKLYGQRVRSRLREMMNVIVWPKDARDKRK